MIVAVLVVLLLAGAGLVLLLALRGTTAESADEELDAGAGPQGPAALRRPLRPPVPAPPPASRPSALTTADRQRQLLGQVQRGTNPDESGEDDAGPPPQTTVWARIVGKPDGDVIRFMEPSIPLVTRCYQRRLRKNSSLAGSISVSFEIARLGFKAVADQAEVAKTEIADPDLEACILRAVSATTFPEWMSHAKRRITYRYWLQPGGEAVPGGARAPAPGQPAPPRDPALPPHEPRPPRDPALPPHEPRPPRDPALPPQEPRPPGPPPP